MRLARRGKETCAIPIPEKRCPSVAIKADETRLRAHALEEISQPAEKGAARIDYFGGMMEVTKERLQLSTVTNTFVGPGVEKIP